MSPVSILVFCGSLAYSLFHTQPGFYGDGPWLLDIWANGGWIYGHPLYLPFCRVVHWLINLFTPLAPHGACFLVSATSGAATLYVVHLALVNYGFSITALVTTSLLFFLSPVHFFSTATEVHSLSLLTATLGGLLCYTPCRTARCSLGLSCLGYCLAVTGHLSSIALGPAYLVLHGISEARAGRMPFLKTYLLWGLVLLASAFGLLATVFLLDEWLGVKSLSWLGFYQSYYHFMFVLYDSDAFRPGFSFLLLTEVLSPYWPLLLPALIGFCLLWNQDRPLAVGLALWVLCFIYSTLRVGAREYGAYMLPALPALAFLCSVFIQRLFRNFSTLSLTLGLFSLIFSYFTIATLAVHLGLTPSKPYLKHFPWIVHYQDLCVPFGSFIASAGQVVPWFGWAIATALSAVGAICLAWARLSPRIASYFFFVFIVLNSVVQHQTLGPFRKRWDVISFAPWVQYARKVKAQSSKPGLIIGFAPDHPSHFILSYFFPGRWINLDFYLQEAGRESFRDILLCNDGETNSTVFLCTDHIILFSLMYPNTPALDSLIADLKEAGDYKELVALPCQITKFQNLTAWPQPLRVRLSDVPVKFPSAMK